LAAALHGINQLEGPPRPSMTDPFTTHRAIRGDLAALANARNRAGAIAGVARANTTSDYNAYVANLLQASAYGN